MMNHTWPSDPAYYNGRYSNGPLWVEGLQYRLGMEMKNYAVSGGVYDGLKSSRFNPCKPIPATTDNDRVQGWDGRVAEHLIPSAVDQINTYLEEISHSRKRVERGLFVFLIGMNDPIFDANMTAEGTVEVISGLLNRLRALGDHSLAFLHNNKSDELEQRCTRILSRLLLRLLEHARSSAQSPPSIILFSLPQLSLPALRPERCRVC